MKKITNYLSLKKNKVKYILLLMSCFFLLVLFLIYHAYKKLTYKTLYVGCLYSKTGVLGEAPYDNYKILVESFKYAVEKYNVRMLNIVPIYKDLGDDLENFSKWVEECVQKYNIKYFFGCWRSSERIQVLPILEKYNAKLFYPLQYEGFESSNSIFYMGACPNQQIIPGLQYIFDTYYYYNDIYIVGSDYNYPRVVTKLIDRYIKDTKNIYNKKLVSATFFSLDETDFSSFINNIFSKNPEGAIIINLINGKSYYTFCKQFYEAYQLQFKNVVKDIFDSHNKIIKYLENPELKNFINIVDRYPNISTSIVENDINGEYIKYITHNLFIWNFASTVVEDRVYYISDGYADSDNDYIFLQNFLKKQNKPIGDPQYCSFISTLFFVRNIKKMIDNNYDLNNTQHYDSFQGDTVTSIGGEHTIQQNHHITKTFYVLRINKEKKFEILYDSYNNIYPAPFSGISDKIVMSDNSKKIYLSDRIYF